MIGQSTQLIGEAPAWLSAQEHVSRVAPLERPILVIGERGTGKELIGERLHFLSKRWEGPFIKVNCAALSEQLLDSELFGHERGAFTGATEQRKGRFELADGGTLFLDEIATASRAVQDKRTYRGCHEHGSAGHGGAGRLSRRSARPARLRCHHAAAIAGPQGRRDAAGRFLCPAHRH